MCAKGARGEAGGCWENLDGLSWADPPGSGWFTGSHPQAHREKEKNTLNPEIGKARGIFPNPWLMVSRKLKAMRPEVG